jgi:hypothetical protein
MVVNGCGRRKANGGAALKQSPTSGFATPVRDGDRESSEQWPHNEASRVQPVTVLLSGRFAHLEG